MQITINTEKDYHPKNHKTESSKTLTVIMAGIVGIILICVLVYAIHAWKNKPDTLFHPVQNKKIRQLLKNAEGVTQESLKEKGAQAEAERIFKSLKQECEAKKLIDDKGDILLPDKYAELPEHIKKALEEGEAAQKAIKDFLELKKASKKDDPKSKQDFYQLVHDIIKTSSDKKETPPTDEQITDARKQLTKKLQQAQEEWNKGKEDNISYTAQYECFRLVTEYTRVKEILKDTKKKPKQ